MKRWGWWLAALALLLVMAALMRTKSPPKDDASRSGMSQVPVEKPRVPNASENLLEGYGDPASEPIEDLRKVHRVLSGYFSVIKDASRFPIGGNADLAAALRGENPNREIFLPGTHPIFSADGLLLDRWKSALIVHPQGWRQIELRSAGPDRVPYNRDDLILSPTGLRE